MLKNWAQQILQENINGAARNILTETCGHRWSKFQFVEKEQFSCVQFITETHTWTSAIVYILLEVDFSRKFEVNFRCEIGMLHLIRRVSNIIRLGESNLALKMFIVYNNIVASMKK